MSWYRGSRSQDSQRQTQRTSVTARFRSSVSALEATNMTPAIFDIPESTPPESFRASEKAAMEMERSLAEKSDGQQGFRISFIRDSEVKPVLEGEV